MPRPAVALPDSVVGHDAFARWQHPAVGALDGDALSDLATRARIGPVIDLRVLRDAVALAATSSGRVARRVYASASEALLSDVYVEHHIWEMTDAVALVARVRLPRRRPARPRSDRSSRIRDTIRSLHDTGCQIVLAGVDQHSDVTGLLGRTTDSARCAWPTISFVASMRTRRAQRPNRSGDRLRCTPRARRCWPGE